MGQLAWAYNFGGPTPPGRGKGGLLVKNIDIVKFEMGPTFPIWPGPITSFAWAWSYPSCFSVFKDATSPRSCSCM